MDLISKFATYLDDEAFPWKKIVVGVTVGQYAFQTYLSYRQFQVQKRTDVPQEMKEVVSQEQFVKSQEYGMAKSKLGFVDRTVSLFQNLAIFKYDLMPKAYAIAGRLLAAWAPKWFMGVGPQSIVMMFGLSLMGTLIDLPLNLYSTFVLEEKFGFNKQTLGLFFSDMLKGQLLGAVIGAPVLMGMLKVIDLFGDNFFFYLWLFMVFVQVAAIAIYPSLIQPMFNKLTPLPEGDLKVKIHELANKVQFPLNKLYVIDGSKRSGHSNAYFMGLPWSKQIVLYDTLIEKSSTDQVASVLAHEIGHWSRSHTTRMMAVAQMHLFFTFMLFSGFVRNQSLYRSFGFFKEMPTLVGFLLFNDILTPVDTVMSFAMNVVSRKYEYEADEYAVTLGYGDNLAPALINIHTENLGTVAADWIYSAYHHSHPLLPERLRGLRVASEKQSKKKE